MGTSVYPGALDDFAEASPPYLADDDTTGRDHPARHDDLEAAMEAVQGELGTDPAGGSATVKARLDAADSTVASKAPLNSPAFTGTVNFTGTSVIGLPVAGLSPSPPSSVANSGGTASLSGNTVTFTGVTSVSLNGCFTGDYDNYALVVVGTAGGNNIQARLRVGGADNTTATSYVWQELVATDTSVTAARTTSDRWIVGTFGGSANNFSFIDMSNVFLSTSTGFFSRNLNDASFARLMTRAGTHNASTSFDGITLYLSGSMTGTVSVYGYKS